MNTLTSNKSCADKYPAYKDSGIEWLEKIPSSWKVERLGNILRPISKKNYPDKKLLSITREKGVIVRDTENDDGNHNFIPDDLSGYKLLEKGQFGMNKMKAWQGSYGVSKHTGIVSPAYYVFKFTEDIYPDFFHIAIRSKKYISFFGQASDGVRIGQWDLSKDRMKKIPFLIPPLPEQTAIANFLDEKTTKIDQAIIQKEKLISLLKERKQILIQQAVTKGLHPDVPLKDSGVEWIGEIPEHWEVKKLKHLVEKIISGPFGSSLVKDEYEKKGFKIYGQEQVIPNDLTIGDYYISKRKFDRMKRYEVFENDILVSCVGTFGKIALVPKEFEKGIINPRLIKMTPKLSKISPSFLHEVLLSELCFSQFNKLSRGGTMGVINIELLSKLLVVLPPIIEQSRILNFIVKKREQINKSIQLQQTQIEKLKEYKAILIDSAVTGKIKVSGI